MPSVREIKHRIGSVKNTQQITRAMKMVAGAKLRRAQERLSAIRPYAHEVADVTVSLVRELDYASLPLLVPPEPDAPSALVLYTADRGLCGAFNANLLRTARSRLEELRNEGRGVRLITIGRKGSSFFSALFNRRPPGNVEHLVIDGLYETAGMAGFMRLAARLEKDIAEGRLSRIEVIFSLFHSVIRQTPTTKILVPVSEKSILEREDKEPAPWTPIVEPDVHAAVEEAMRRFLAIGFYKALIENWTSEMGARMTAMDAATNNADELITSLTLEFNKARQSEITEQIVDIAGGAEALRQQ